MITSRYSWTTRRTGGSEVTFHTRDHAIRDNFLYFYAGGQSKTPRREAAVANGTGVVSTPTFPHFARETLGHRQMFVRVTLAVHFD